MYSEKERSEIQNKLGRMPEFINYLNEKPKAVRYEGINPLIGYLAKHGIEYDQFDAGKFYDEKGKVVFSAQTYTKLVQGGEGYAPAGQTYGELITRCHQVLEVQQIERRQAAKA